MSLADRIRDWRIDRMTDRIARRPTGRRARATYGADDAHSFLWEPLLEALALGPDDHLLDVGCGGGIFLRRALETGCRATGVDHSREMVRLARAKSGVRVEHAEADALPFAGGEFTAISSIQAFFFFADPVAVLRELRRVLDPKRGRIAIFTSSPESKGTPASPYPLATRGHYYDDDALVQLPLEAGFRESRIAHREDWAQLLVAQP